MASAAETIDDNGHTMGTRIGNLVIPYGYHRTAMHTRTRTDRVETHFGGTVTRHLVRLTDVEHDTRSAPHLAAEMTGTSVATS
jgi:hypothetical protein